jgi:predicted nucleotidyltransferase
MIEILRQTPQHDIVTQSLGKERVGAMVIRRLKKISDKQKEAIIEALKAFLQTHEEIRFALLFGSLVNSVEPERYGDIDLALYVRPETLAATNYVFESQFEAEAYGLFSQQGLNLLPIEALVINNAPYSFLSKVFNEGYIILKEDEEALTDFIEEVGEKSMANYHFRSESLREVVEG